jgi:hypothetical protein
LPRDGGLSVAQGPWRGQEARAVAARVLPDWALHWRSGGWRSRTPSQASVRDRGVPILRIP